MIIPGIFPGAKFLDKKSGFVWVVCSIIGDDTVVLRTKSGDSWYELIHPLSSLTYDLCRGTVVKYEIPLPPPLPSSSGRPELKVINKVIDLVEYKRRKANGQKSTT